jgi:hypothetical protein
MSLSGSTMKERSHSLVLREGVSRALAIGVV